ncbi:IS110 family transposase [Paenibacillus sp. UMB4589-SE434]|uniref:IS110 family transposase n=1 Tax=Paenibacillus sp. UMB4589-SE434 TaxID=3046314 RepID=UPI00254CC26B|nr:IS110 family transposase [Paenibacillus sp. UMB4589-SE434]MDK8182625.1 IS110 family transposase [Paenibacillus sp. UMB4589-SE434]
MENYALEEEIRLKHVFIGIDLHKNHHTAVFLNGFKRKLGSFKFDNKPSEFPKLVAEAKKYIRKGISPVYGLEDTGGYGRALAVYLVEQKHTVKEVNPALPNGIRKANPIVQKSDEWDAECVGHVLIDKFESLPTAKPMDQYWVIAQLVTTRTAAATNLTVLINQLHAQLGHHYPSYRKFFAELDGKTALAFFEQYPSPHLLKGTTVQELREFLLKPSNYACSIKTAEKILSMIKEDGDTTRDYQAERDFIIQSHIRRIRNCKEEMQAIEQHLKLIMQDTGYQLDSMYGIDIVTAAGFVAEIGNIHRFTSAQKLARFAGIAPVFRGSGDKGKYYKCKQGNRTLHELFYRLACRQIGTKRGSKEPNNPYYYAYYKQKLSAGKTKTQAIICVMRKLVDVVYALMKHKTMYVKPIILNEQAG